MTIGRSSAALMAVGFEMGLYSRADVGEWVGAEVERLDVLPEALLELTVMGGKHDVDIANLLRALMPRPLTTSEGAWMEMSALSYEPPAWRLGQSATTAQTEPYGSCPGWPNVGVAVSVCWVVARPGAAALGWKLSPSCPRTGSPSLPAGSVFSKADVGLGSTAVVGASRSRTIEVAMNLPVITDAIWVAHAQCARKAFLLLHGEAGTTSEYVQAVERRARRTKTRHLESLGVAAGLDQPDLATGTPIIAGGHLREDGVEASCDLLTRTSRGPRSRPTYEPVLVVGTHGVSPEHRDRLLFVGHVLGGLQGRSPAHGSVVTADDAVHRVPLGERCRQVEARLAVVRQVASGSEPPVIINRHCPTCQFRAACEAKAVASDDLSLLHRMTPRLMARYRKKGIFTVTQLSYVYRPRRSRKRPLKPKSHFNVELQALAIRTGKTYVHDLPTLSRAPVELFIDLEGIPDQRFNYLLGVLVVEGDSKSYHPHWIGDSPKEGLLWTAIKSFAKRFPTAPIYHYGSYEPKAIESMARKHGQSAASIKSRLVNLSGQIFGRIYFPVRSNTLKEIGRFVGATWRSPDASGLQSIAWRYAWEDGRDSAHKKRLLQYNEDDCLALYSLTKYIDTLKSNAASDEAVDFVHKPKRTATDAGAAIHGELERILRSAHLTYTQKRISFRDGTRPRRRSKPATTRRPRPVRGRPKIIKVRPQRVCPAHRGELLTPSRKRWAEAIVTDIVFGASGCRKTVIKYVGQKAYCNQNSDYYNPPVIRRLGGRRFGPSFCAWVAYLRVTLRLPYEMIARFSYDMLGVDVPDSTVVHVFADASRLHQGTQRVLERRILEAPAVHVDETRINIQGRNQYVWVLTDGRHVTFRLTETRETTVIHEFLNGYRGVLVSDFYPGYDAIPCKQQKCLVHLIRDLNDDLWINAFDRELEGLVSEVKELLVPILSAIDRYGRKARYLRRFRRGVDKFYKHTIDGRSYDSEVCSKFQTRFDRYRETLFVFLETDGVPWENNMAERAIRQLAVQRKISGFFYEDGARTYLRLLAIAQSCRFQEKSFLQFLLSGMKDVDAFKGTGRGRARPWKG